MPHLFPHEKQKNTEQEHWGRTPEDIGGRFGWATVLRGHPEIGSPAAARILSQTALTNQNAV